MKPASGPLKTPRLALRRYSAGRLLALTALTAGLSLTTPGLRSQEPSPGIPLGVASPVQASISSGDTHVYRLPFLSRKHLRVAVEQQGVDVTATVRGPDACSQPTVNSPRKWHGFESVFLDGTHSGHCRLEVRAGSTGRYRIEIEALKPDPARLKAEAALMRAGQRYFVGTSQAWREAQTEFESALSLRSASDNPAEHVRILFSLAVVKAQLGLNSQAQELFRRTLDLWDARSDPQGEAATWNWIGFLNSRGGRLDAAISDHEKALALRRQRRNVPGQAQSLINLGILRIRRGDPWAAQELLGEALPLIRQIGDRELEADTLEALGGTSEALGEPLARLAYFQQALALRRSLGQPRKEAITLNNIGVALRSLGEYQKALSHYEDGLQLARKSSDQRGQAIILNSLGFAYLYLGEPRKALAYFEQSLPLRRSLGNPLREAITLNNIGRAHRSLGETDQALSLNRQALQIFRRVEHPRRIAIAQGAIGSLLAESDDPKSALALFGEALQGMRSVGDVLGQAEILSKIAQLRLRMRQPAAALEQAETALRLSREVDDPIGQAQARLRAAQAQIALDRIIPAQLHLEEAIDIIESLRAKISNPDQRASFLAARQETYETLIAILMRRHRDQPFQGHVRKAFEISERSRARSLLDWLSQVGDEIGAEVEPEATLQRRRLQQRLDVKALKRQDLVRRGETSARERIDQDIQQIVAELQAVEARAGMGRPSVGQPRPLLAEQVQALLDSDTLFLQYHLGTKASFLWIVTPETVEGFELAGRERIEQAVREAYALWTALDPADRKRQDEAAAMLSRLILAPVAERLRRQRLVIVADGSLHYVPFAALPAPPDAGAQSDAAGREPLLHRHEIVALPSASVLDLLRRQNAQRTAPDKALAVLADPVLNRDDPRLRGLAASARGSAASASDQDASGGLQDEEPRYARLGWSRQEAERIASMPPQDSVLKALDFDASMQTVRSGGLARYRLIHFATHGILDSSTPELSGLLLSRFAPSGESLDEASFLRLHHIYHLNLRADLVVLSGCQTALGKEIRGEGLSGLARGFINAGASRVIASLWPVQDRPTLELMTELYRSILSQGMPPSQALRRAQLSLLADERWGDPYHWAAFVLQGDWRRSEERSP